MSELHLTDSQRRIFRTLTRHAMTMLRMGVEEGRFPKMTISQSREAARMVAPTVLGSALEVDSDRARKTEAEDRIRMVVAEAVAFVTARPPNAI